MADTILQISELVQNGHGLTAGLLRLSPGEVDDLWKEKLGDAPRIRHTGHETPIMTIPPDQVTVEPLPHSLTFPLTTHDLTSRRFEPVMRALEGRLADEHDSTMIVDHCELSLKISTPEHLLNATMTYVDGYLAGWRDARFA